MASRLFSLRNGEALGAPAFDPLPCWQVEREGDRVFVRNKATSMPPVQQLVTATEQPKNIVIVGGGAAGFACAEMLRRRGYDGQLTILSDDADAPCDRPNLSKDYLAGTAPEEWMPLRSEDYYKDNHIDLQLDTHVQHIDTVNYQLTTREGRNIAFDRLVLATGAEPVRLPIPGQESSHVFTLRSFADSRRIIEHAHNAKHLSCWVRGLLVWKWQLPCAHAGWLCILFHWINARYKMCWGVNWVTLSAVCTRNMA